MKTIFLLMAEYGCPAIELKLCYHYLGYTSNAEAQTAALNYTIQIPVFRCRESQKAPRMVMLEDLANYLDQCAEAARSDFEKVHS